MSQLEGIVSASGIDISSFSTLMQRGDERIFGLLVNKSDAITQWHKLRELAGITGYWPVVGWGKRWIEDAPQYEARVRAGSTDDIIEASRHVDLAQWRREQINDYLEVMADEVDEIAPADFFADVEGEWPENVEPTTAFTITKHSATRDTPLQVPIALVPATAGWEALAQLRFDAGMLPTAVHVAFARRWNDLYGSEVVGVLPDLIEMRVARPPTTPEAAIELAKEQFVYCHDIVIQGTETIQQLAACLLNGTVWFFWWD